jgi:hypothetical protein
VLDRGRPDDLTLGGDELVGLEVVAGQAVLPGQPAHPATEGEPADAGVGDVAGRGGQAVGLGGDVQRAEQRAALDPGQPPGRVDRDPAHRGEVDHEAAVGDGMAEDAVPAAADADLQAGLPGGADGGGDVGDAGAAHDRGRVVVDHGVPDRAGLVVARLAGPEQLAVELPAELGESDLVHGSEADIDRSGP